MISFVQPIATGARTLGSPPAGTTSDQAAWRHLVTVALGAPDDPDPPAQEHTTRLLPPLDELPPWARRASVRSSYRVLVSLAALAGLALLLALALAAGAPPLAARLVAGSGHISSLGTAATASPTRRPATATPTASPTLTATPTVRPTSRPAAATYTPVPPPVATAVPQRIAPPPPPAPTIAPPTTSPPAPTPLPTGPPGVQWDNDWSQG